MRFNSVDLPEPDGPISAMKSPPLDVEIDLMQRLDLLLAALIDLAHLANLEPERSLRPHSLL